MRDKRTGSRWLAVLICLQLFLLLTACQGNRSSALMTRQDPLDPYFRAALEHLEGCHLKQTGGDTFYTLTGGGALAAFDVQAIPAINQGVGRCWYPQCLATVVIAVDRAQTDAEITGWRDLPRAGVDVCWHQEEGAQRLLLGALSYGLEGPGWSRRAGLELLEQLYIQGHFCLDDWDAPVLICFDYQAEAWRRQGRPLEIVVPVEGTYSYAMGLMSDHLLDVPSDDALLRAGLRLLDGRHTGGYPPESAYAPAVRVEDMEHLLSETSGALRDIRRSVTHRRYLSTADGREHIMVALVGVVLTLCWMGTAMHRSLRQDIQRGIRLSALLIVGWLTLRLFKYQLPPLSLVNRVCWYGYYIFMLGLPLSMLYIACIFDRPEAAGRPARWFRWVAGLYPVLLLVVFTNDLHQLVFRFDLRGDWQSIYHYGPGYVVVFAYCILTFLASFAVLIRKSWKSPKRIGWLLPALIGVLILAYCVSYALGVSLIRDGDIATTICLFAVLFFEASLHTGLLPANTRYRELFRSSPLDMQLLDDAGRTVLSSRRGLPLEPQLRRQLQARPSVVVNHGASELLFGHSIQGGTVVWREDLSTLNALHRQIQTSVRRLEAANALLSREEEVRRRKLAVDLKARLFASLERETETRTAELSRAIRNLRTAENRPDQIAYITLLLCHIKRRCNLFFIAQEGARVPGVELSMYLDELSEFAGYAGVRALVRCKAPDTLNVRLATLCYDFYFSALSWSARGEKDTLLGQLEENDRGLSFSILTGEGAGDFDFPQALREGVQAAGGRVYSRELEETGGLYLEFPGGGAEHG